MLGLVVSLLRVLSCNSCEVLNVWFSGSAEPLQRELHTSLGECAKGIY
ncbi:hypothetical protein PF006_g33592 [Phytophthora fragariae]|uniref:Uncharacterized protein n=1 Tax=Phytophthora fragariae TaxID=53985 RepID=A0A6A3PEN9_9STRA|nr:hypothetical protein PF006_g33592 [Phytophthora fragariae]